MRCLCGCLSRRSVLGLSVSDLNCVFDDVEDADHDFQERLCGVAVPVRHPAQDLQGLPGA